jgi:hypothetical protein
MDFAPGSHQIVVSHPDFHPFSTTENKQAGEEIRIQFALLPKKATLTIPVMTPGTTVCIVQSPSEEPLPTQCQVTPNSPYTFEPQPKVKYYVRVSKKDFKPAVLPMNLEGLTLWSPPTVVALEKAETTPATPDTPPSDHMREPIVVVVPMPPDMSMEMQPDMPPDMPPDMVAGNTGSLRLNSKPTAIIMVNGQNMGYTPKKLDLPSGTHKITLINNEQGLRKTISVTIKSGTTITEIVRFDE